MFHKCSFCLIMVDKFAPSLICASPMNFFSGSVALCWPITSVA